MTVAQNMIILHLDLWLENQNKAGFDLNFFCQIISWNISSTLEKKSVTLEPWSSRSALFNTVFLVSSGRYSQISGMGNTIWKSNQTKHSFLSAMTLIVQSKIFCEINLQYSCIDFSTKIPRNQLFDHQNTSNIWNLT